MLNDHIHIAKKLIEAEERLNTLNRASGIVKEYLDETLIASLQITGSYQDVLEKQKTKLQTVVKSLKTQLQKTLAESK